MHNQGIMVLRIWDYYPESGRDY